MKRRVRARLASGFETLEDRRVLAASLGWDGPGLGSAELTYHVANAPPGLSQSQVDEAVRTALDAWSEAADLTFEQTDRPGLRNSIDISFRPLDGQGDILAQAYFPDDLNSPIIAGDIVFDASENWEIGNGLGGRAFDLVSVAAHEIGHSLGLEHSDHDSVLAPTISPNELFVGLSEHDVEAIQSLYAPATEQITPTQEDIELAVDDSNPMQDRIRRFADRFRPWTTQQVPTEGATDNGGLANNDGMVTIFRPTNRMHNFLQPRDVNGDQFVSPMDVLLIINTINSGTDDSTHQCDTNNDGIVSPMDVLLVVNELNNPETVSTELPPPAGEGTAESDGDTPLEEGPIVEESDEADEHDEHSSDTRQIGNWIGRLERIASGLFSIVDTNDDGLLTETEVPPVLWERLVGYGLDTDDDQGISLDEIYNRIDTLRLEVFQDRDLDDSGELTEDEVGETRWNRLANADTDSSGGVSFEELQEFRSLSRFDQIDADLSGGLSETELGEERWRRLSRFDADENGELSEEELPQRWNHGRRPTPFGQFVVRTLRFAGIRRFFT